MKAKYRIKKMKTDREKQGGPPIYIAEKRTDKGKWEQIYSGYKDSCKNYVNYLKIEKLRDEGKWQEVEK